MLPAVSGLHYLPDELDAPTHDRLLAAADREPWQFSHEGRGVQVYGYNYHPHEGR